MGNLFIAPHLIKPEAARLDANRKKFKLQTQTSDGLQTIRRNEKKCRHAAVPSVRTAAKAKSVATTSLTKQSLSDTEGG